MGGKESPALPKPFDTPVVFLTFNRPDVTERVFAAIRQARPRQLWFVSDGPRPDRPGETEQVARCRKFSKRIDWDCELRTEFSTENLGCKRRISSALDRVFAEVEQAVILEDDCLPDPTFFSFCDELLQRHRDDRRVMAISGNNFQFGRSRTSASYYFSRHFHCWGWATWRRAWECYDGNMADWPEFSSRDGVASLVNSPRQAAIVKSALQQCYDGELNTWDYAMQFAIWRDAGLVALPNVNLVTNIGFGDQATHTTAKSSILADVPLEGCPTVIHPEEVRRHDEADRFTNDLLYGQSQFRFWRRLGRSIQKRWRKISPRAA